MSSRRVHRSALVAVALVVAGCSSTGTEGQTSVPGQPAPSKQSAQATAEERQRDVAQATQQERQTRLEQSARAKLEEVQAEQSTLKEAARTRLAEVARAAQAERQARLNETTTTQMGANSTR